MNAERKARIDANLKIRKTSKMLRSNNTSFSGSFCLKAIKQKDPHKEGIFQPTRE